MTHLGQSRIDLSGEPAAAVAGQVAQVRLDVITLRSRTDVVIGFAQWLAPLFVAAALGGGPFLFLVVMPGIDFVGRTTAELRILHERVRAQDARIEQQAKDPADARAAVAELKARSDARRP